MMVSRDPADANKNIALISGITGQVVTKSTVFHI